LILDTSGLLAALFPDQHRHHAARTALESATAPLVLSPFVLAELDYFIGRWAGVEAEVRFLADVASGAYLLAPFGADAVAAAMKIIDDHADLGLGLADASIVVLADRFDTTEILTLDERHFRAVSTHDDRPFRLLPADA
jgi:predicted nucleic acid-binding protein